MQAVVDTNVLVSGLISSGGPPATIVNAIENGALVPVYSEPIMEEYIDVLLRPDLDLEKSEVFGLLASIDVLGEPVDPAGIDDFVLPDIDDTPFYAAAITAQCPLITGNLKHFPTDGPVIVISPRQAVEQFFTVI